MKESGLIFTFFSPILILAVGNWIPEPILPFPEAS